MGFDVVGISPKNETGAYFRASMWTWHPLIHTLERCCSTYDKSKLGGRSFFEDISHNSGFGATAPQCTLLANKLIRYLEHNVHGITYPEAHLSLQARGVAEIARTVRRGRKEDLGELPESLHDYTFSVCDDTIAQFVKFLQNCGGFSVH